MAQMAGLIAGPFAAVLEANRDELNRRFAEVRASAPALQPDEFVDALRTLVTPTVDAVVAEGGAAAVIGTELYDIALDLCAQGRLAGAVRRGWEHLLPVLGRQLAERPRPMIAAVTNALTNLDQAPGARPDQWIEVMTEVAATGVDADSWQRAGLVAAWRSGLAAYRSSALEVAATLDAAVVSAALGGPDILAASNADPWYDPRTGGRCNSPVRVGGFRGLGGPFLSPPLVAAGPSGVVATDGDGWWLLFADAFGTAAVRTPVPVPAPPRDVPQAPEELAFIPELTSWARGPGCLVATSTLSYAVIFQVGPG
jgi:hypothetical protein